MKMPPVVGYGYFLESPNIGRLQSILVTAQRTADTIDLYVYVLWKFLSLH